MLYSLIFLVIIFLILPIQFLIFFVQTELTKDIHEFFALYFKQWVKDLGKMKCKI